MWNIPVKNFEFGPVVQEEMPFNYISYLELWQHFCSEERNHLCKFVRSYQEEQYCKIILNVSEKLPVNHIHLT